jgi:probable rRNA maturation factor
MKPRKRPPVGTKNLQACRGGLHHGPSRSFWGLRLVIVHSQVQGVSARALGRFAARAQRAAGVRGEVDVLITSSAELRRLNRCFRGKDHATDVLSFPSGDGKFHHGVTEARRIVKRNSSVSLCLGGGCSGDIAISAEVAARNARSLGHRPADEIKILILHGLLHLAGYDHETDAGEMARKEAHLRRALRLPAALTERTTPADSKIHHGGTETQRKGAGGRTQDAGTRKRVLPASCLPPPAAYSSTVPPRLRGGRSARQS